MKNLKLNPTNWTKLPQIDIVWFILISLWVWSCFFVLKEPSWFGPSPKKFQTLGTLPLQAHLWTTIHKIETNVLPMAHLFTLYTWGLNFGHTIVWDIIQVLLGTCWGTTLELVEPFGDLMETLWKHDGNTLGIRKNSRVVILFVFQYLAIILSYPTTLAIKLPSESMRKMIWN
jgi:hypothetical protein